MTAGKGNLDHDNRNQLGPISERDVPQGRAGEESDIAGAILYLCGRSGWYIDGAELIVDGGRLKVVPSKFVMAHS
jgi:NAD(P)-dependent dehydrogenase (short-subunit alcohol dehydrogenase family)